MCLFDAPVWRQAKSELFYLAINCITDNSFSSLLELLFIYGKTFLIGKLWVCGVYCSSVFHLSEQLLHWTSSLDKNCVRICIQNLLHFSADVPGQLLAEVAVAVFSFIRDTYALNPALFMEFDNNNGYEALDNILKRWD